MDVHTLLHTASILLLVTALGGIVMGVRRLVQKANPPDWLAMAHGLLAGSALTLLIYAAFTQGIPGAALLGTALLVAASAGGVIMNLAYHLAGKLLPAWLLGVHIALAVIGTGLVSVVAWAA